MNNALLEPNSGDRPSRLQLARYATGELNDEERSLVQRWLDDNPDGQAFLDELEAARSEVRPMDLAALRRSEEAPVVPVAANNTRWLGMVIALAAALMLVALPQLVADPDETREGIVFRGGEAALLVYQLRGDKLYAYRGAALQEGDALGFQVRTAGYERVVVLGIDGNGELWQAYPMEGVADPMQVGGSSRATESLPGSIILDGAPGPDLYIAVFDTSIDAARRAARTHFAQGGVSAVLQWADDEAEVDAVVVERR